MKNSKNSQCYNRQNYPKVSSVAARAQYLQNVWMTQPALPVVNTKNWLLKQKVSVTDVNVLHCISA